jgi:hypothetical protein
VCLTLLRRLTFLFLGPLGRPPATHRHDAVHVIQPLKPLYFGTPCFRFTVCNKSEFSTYSGTDLAVSLQLVLYWCSTHQLAENLSLIQNTRHYTTQRLFKLYKKVGFFSVSSYTSSALKHKPEREATIMKALFVLTEGCLLQRRVEFLQPHRVEPVLASGSRNIGMEALPPGLH